MKKILERCLPLTLLILLVLPLFILSTPVSAAHRYPETYVNAATGSDDYSGLSPVYTGGGNGPLKSIGHAINQTDDNGIVHVAAGTYTELVELGRSMNLVGESALNTTINANRLGCAVTVSSTLDQVNTISGFTIRGGGPDNGDPGGGIYIAPSHTVTINDCIITDNIKENGLAHFAHAGAGVCNNAGLVYLNRCTINGNTSDGIGGGIANMCDTPIDDFCEMSLTNCTVSGNTADSSGGGIYNDEETTMNLLNVTIANNQCTGGGKSRGGGFAIADSSRIFFLNCIVANNTAGYSQFGNGYSESGSGARSDGHNLDSQDSCYFHRPGDIINADPQLGALQNNGGTTPTCAITKSSLAYNHGNLSAAPATDQRGFTRPAGICSIGAYEVVATSVSIGTNLGTVNFSVGNGTINNLVHLRVVDTRCATPAGYDFPYGLFSFKINDLTTGQTVRITIKFPRTLPLDVKYYKCINGKMVDCTRIMTRLNDHTLALAITDGGFGDADGLANGIIVDPGGPAEQVTTAQVYGQGTIPAVTQQAPVTLPAISVKSASLSATKVTPGTPVTVTANVANTGTSNGTSSIKVYVNGQEESSQGVTVSSGGSTPLTFTVSRNEPGTYTVYVGGTSAGSFVVDQFADGTILFISGAMILFALVIGVIYITRRRQAL